MKIRLKNIRANPVIGVYDLERTGPQPVLINLTIDFDEGDSPETDLIDDTLDYCELTKQLVRDVNETQFELLEKLVNYVADHILEQPRVSRVKVEIDKPEALKKFADSVSLTLVRER